MEPADIKSVVMAWQGVMGTGRERRGHTGKKLEPTQRWPGRVTLGSPFSLPEPQRHGHPPLGQGGSLGDSFTSIPVL